MGTATADLATAVDAVVHEDIAVLTLEQLQQRFAAVAPQVERLLGYKSLIAAELESRTSGRLPVDGGRTRSVAGWTAETSGDSAAATGRLIRIAGALQAALPVVTQAVLDGTVSFASAQVLARLVGRIDHTSLREAQADLVVAAQRMDPVQLAAYVRHLVATWVEPVLDADEASASARRYLQTRRESDGSLWGSFRLAAGDAETVLTTLEPLARLQGVQDSRSAAQRRADALVEVCEQVLRHGDLPDAGGQRPHVSYVVPADWAAGRTSSSFRDAVRGSAERGCAVAAWTGPQTRARVESALCDARISRVLTDGLGQVQGLAALTDSVTASQRRALAARDRGCAVRGCTRPPAMCDAHHVVPRVDGGPTTMQNLVLLCRRHHVLWHLGKIDLRELQAPWLLPQSTAAPP